MKRRKAFWLTVLILIGAYGAPILVAWPWSRPKPTGSLTFTPATIKAGESTTRAWSGEGGTVYLDGQVVSPAGKDVLRPKETITSWLQVTGGRWRQFQTSATVTVVQDPIPPGPGPQPPDPPQPPTPPSDCGLSAVGIGSAFALSDSLAKAAADHDLRVFIESQQGTWLVIDPLQLAAPHPATLDAWVKVLTDSSKKQPAVIWYSAKGGKTTVLGIDECGPATTGADLLKLARSHVPAPTDVLVINGKTRKLGLKGPNKGRKATSRSVAELLKPLAPDKYPMNVDLRGQFPRVQDQGPHGTCVSNSMSGCYEAAVVRYFGARNATAFSPNFLATVGDGWNGAWGSDIAAILQATGVVTLTEQPNYSSKLPADWKAKAAKNKALGVYGPPQGNSRGYVAAAIARGLPVSVAIAVGNGFSPDSGGYISYARGAGGSVNHQVIAAGGYFEHDGKRWWIMKNSWGEDWGVWGDGCCFLEDRFLDDDTDMWVIVVPTANESYKLDFPPAPQSNVGNRYPRIGPTWAEPRTVVLVPTQNGFRISGTWMECVVPWTEEDDVYVLPARAGEKNLALAP